jgi:hypothetical protein
MKRLVARGEVRLVFDSKVARIDADHVVLEAPGPTGRRLQRVPYDHALVLIGGTPSWQLVRAAGVELAVQPTETMVDSGG